MFIWDYSASVVKEEWYKWWWECLLTILMSIARCCSSHDESRGMQCVVKFNLHSAMTNVDDYVDDDGWWDRAKGKIICSTHQHAFFHGTFAFYLNICLLLLFQLLFSFFALRRSHLCVVVSKLKEADDYTTIISYTDIYLSYLPSNIKYAPCNEYLYIIYNSGLYFLCFICIIPVLYHGTVFKRNHKLFFCDVDKLFAYYIVSFWHPVGLCKQK